MLHVTLGFKQRAERGQWSIACGSGWLFANTQQRCVFFKGLVPIHYCLHTLKSSHKIYCYTPFNWAEEAFHLMHCASQIVAPFQRLPNSISFPSIFHHIPWSLMLQEGTLMQPTTSIFQLSSCGWARGQVYMSVSSPQWLNEW